MRRTLIDVDERGRASLAKLGFKNTQLVAEKISEGVYTLQVAVIWTEVESRHYSDAGAVAALTNARQSQQEGRVRPGRLRTRQQTS